MMNYKKEKKIKIPSQNVKPDPRGAGSYRAGNSPLPTGDKVTVKGVGKARKQTATWY
jgi:hypothetical protein